MTRVLLLFVGALFLAACGDDETPPVECDPEHFDCTPIVTEPTCDPEKFDCTPAETTPKEPAIPAWVPSKDELRAVGVLFPEDEGFGSRSWTAPKESGVWGTDWFQSARLSGIFGFLYRDCMDDEAHEHEDFGIGCFYQEPVLSGYASAVDYWNSWLGAGDFKAYIELAKAAEYSCLVEFDWNGLPWHEGPPELVATARLYQWADERATLHAPPTRSEAWTCIETPYGAAWVEAEGAREAVAGDRSLQLAEPLARHTCHQTESWIAFTGTGGDRVPPVAYTAGSRYDAFLPVAGCAPWGSQSM